MSFMFLCREAAALGVTLTDKQVLEGIRELVKRSLANGGRSAFVKTLAVTDASLARVLNQFVENVPGMLHVPMGTQTRNRLVFQGLEVRAVRDIDHMAIDDLREMAESGKGPVLADGSTVRLHHHRQSANGFIVEMPTSRHSIGNVNQHPYGNTPGMGLTDLEREEFGTWRKAYWKARAREALLRQGVTP